MTLEHNESLSVKNPYLEWMGMTLKEWSPGYAEMHLPVSKRLGNRTGRVHGGVICTLLDSVSGYSGLYAPPGSPELHSLTLSLTTNFLDSRDGKVLVGKGYVERKGRSVFFTRAEGWVDNDIQVRSEKQTQEHTEQRY